MSFHPQVANTNFKNLIHMRKWDVLFFCPVGTFAGLWKKKVSTMFLFCGLMKKPNPRSSIFTNLSKSSNWHNLVNIGS